MFNKICYIKRPNEFFEKSKEVPFSFDSFKEFEEFISNFKKENPNVDGFKFSQSYNFRSQTEELYIVWLEKNKNFEQELEQYNKDIKEFYSEIK